MIGLRYQNYTHSVETFINLVERIEDYMKERSPRLSAEALIKVLLRRYAGSTEINRAINGFFLGLELSETLASTSS